MVKEEYEDWIQHHRPIEIEFESNEQTGACEESVTMEIAAAGREEPKEWNITPIASLEVHK